MAAGLSLHLSHLNQLVTCSLCHGLLKQATSLCCNHHFCMACILDFTSKAGSCCPKCKLPASKQQAKYSPEFDRLVTIYQGLELAAASIQPFFPESGQDLHDAGAGKHIHNGCKKPRGFDRGAIASTSECSAERKNLDDGFEDPSACTSVKKRKQEVSFRGCPPMSKRVQLPCPLSGQSVEHEEGVFSMKRKGLVSEDVLKNEENLAVETQGIPLQPDESSMTEIAGAEKLKGKLCLPVEDAKGGLVIGDVVGIMANSNQSLNGSNSPGNGIGSQSQDLKLACNFEKRSFDSEALTECRSNHNNLALDQVSCAFCQTSNDSLLAGPMMHYEKGVPVKPGRRIKSLVSVHQHCAEWAPNVYYVGEVAKNLLKEVARGQKLKCSCCGLKGAVLGCLVKRCAKSYHYPCAQSLPCRWDDGNYLVLCPEHISSRLPSDDIAVKPIKMENEPESTPGTEAQLKRNEPVVNENKHFLPNNLRSQTLFIEECEAVRSDKLVAQVTIPEPKKISEISNKSPPGVAYKWVVCGSGLKSKSNELLVSFANHTGAKFTRTWHPCVTHLICGTNEMGAASRTLKFLLATLAGSWILKSEWLDACMAAQQPVCEEPFEVNLDIHGMVGGPKHARMLAASRTHDLFEGFEFYFLGDYSAAYKADLRALITAAGGKLLTELQDGANAEDALSYRVVVYNADTLPYAEKAHDCQEVIRGRWLEAKSQACKVRAHAVGHTWILDSIAACELQPFH